MEQLCCLPKQCSLTFVILTLSEAMRKDLCISLSLRCCTSARNSLVFVILRGCDFLHEQLCCLPKQCSLTFVILTLSEAMRKDPMYISTKLSRFFHPEML